MANFYAHYLDKIKSFSYDKFILAIHNDPFLIDEDELKEKIKELSSRLKGWVESKDQESKEHEERSKAHKALLIFHLCPWLIRSKEFSWLFQDICALIKKSHSSSTAFKEYWETLQSVKKEFRATKANKPELPFKVFDTLREQKKAKADELKHEKSLKAVEVLKNFFKHHEDFGFCSDLSRKLPFSFEIIDEELRRLSGLVERHRKNKQVSPMEEIEKYHHIIINEIYTDRNSNKKFWDHVLKRKQFLKEEKEILPLAKKETLRIFKEQKRKMSERTMRRHLKHLNDLWKKSEVF